MGCNLSCYCNPFLIEQELNLPGAKQFTEGVESPHRQSTRASISVLSSSPSTALQDESQAIFQGSLYKYHPGLHSAFLSRYCRLTKAEFLCYKSVESFRLFPERVLRRIPLTEIQKCSKSQKKNVFFFELFLKQEDSMVPVSRETDKDLIDKNQLIRTFSYDVPSAVEGDKLMRKPLRADTLCPLLSKEGWSFREIQWYSSEKRLLFKAPSKITHTQWTDAISSALNKVSANA